jgi:hypothetical protein
MKVNLTYWRSILREAELELEAAATREALNRAAARLMGREGAAEAVGGSGRGRIPFG